MKAFHSLRKPRIQGKLANLPKDQLARVRELFRGNLTYQEIQKRIQEEIGVKISCSSLSEYYHKNALEFTTLAKRAESQPGEAPYGVTIHLHFYPHSKDVEIGSR